MSIKHLHKVKIAFCYTLSTYVVGNILSFNRKKRESSQDIENLGLHATHSHNFCLGFVQEVLVRHINVSSLSRQ